MDTLDLLIKNFQELKEELRKDSPLHSTVEGFMGSLKTLPKGSPERGKFITSHMNHGPFLGALKAHPQGAQMHTMLMGHLNSKANAGFKPGAAQVVAKADAPGDPSWNTEWNVQHDAPHGMYRTSGGLHDRSPKKSRLVAVHYASNKSPEKWQHLGHFEGKDAATKARLEHHDRISAGFKKSEDLEKGLFSPKQEMSSFKPSFKGHSAAMGVGQKVSPKGVTTERKFDPMSQKINTKKYMELPETLKFEKNGQWNLGKNVNGSYSASPNAGPPAGGDTNHMAMSEKLACSENGQWSIKKADLCAKCHASPCQCNKVGINVEKIDGAGGDVGSGI